MKIRSAIDTLSQDLRYGSRSLRNHPGFAAIVVITLALGIGANSAIFSLVYAAVLRPLPFPQAHRLLFLATGKSQTNHFDSGVSGRELEDWRPQLRKIFDRFATLSANHDTTWTIAGQGAHLANRDVSANFFHLLGVHPWAGRAFTAEDTTQGHGDVALLSYPLWQQRFGGDIRALGQSIRKKGGAFAVYTIVGILPPDFAFDEPTDVWTPQQPQPASLLSMRAVRVFRVIGLLRPEVDLRQARAAMNMVAVQEAQAFPASNQGWGINVIPLPEHFQANGHFALLLLWAAVGSLLLIACANTANLLLARSGARASEISIRLALGSSRARLMTQLLTENSLLALVGGCLGWLAAAWSLRLLDHWGSPLLPPSTMQEFVRWHAGALNPAVAGFTMLISMLAVLVFGLTPAWRSTSPELNHALQSSSGSRNTHQHRTSQILVSAEAALVMMLLMSAGLLIRSFVKLTEVDPGFQSANRVTFDIELPRLVQSAAASHPVTPGEFRLRWQRQALWFDELARRLHALPGVQAAGASNAFPLATEEGGWGVNIDGKQLPESTSMASVIPGYFDAMAIPIVEGSDFSLVTDSVSGSKAIILNQTMAKLLFSGDNATGKHIHAPRCQLVTSDKAASSDCVVVGVVRDTRFALDAPAPPIFYYSLYQDLPDRVTYVLRASHDAAELIPRVRALVANMPPINSAPAYLFNLQTMDQMVANSVATPRFRSWLTGLFAGLSLLLAAVGIYGVQAYAVSRRTREIGIRMALGAKPAALFAMILAEAAGWTLLGVGIGLGGGLAITRLMSGLLFGVSRWDAVTLALSSLVLLAVALAAAYAPARRAMRVDPLIALRFE